MRLSWFTLASHNLWWQCGQIAICLAIILGISMIRSQQGQTVCNLVPNNNAFIWFCNIWSCNTTRTVNFEYRPSQKLSDWPAFYILRSVDLSRLNLQESVLVLRKSLFSMVIPINCRERSINAKQALPKGGLPRGYLLFVTQFLLILTWM